MHHYRMTDECRVHGLCHSEYDVEGALPRLRDHVHAHADVGVFSADPGALQRRRPSRDAEVPVHRHRVRPSRRAVGADGRRVRLPDPQSEGPRHDGDRQSAGRAPCVRRLRPRRRRRARRVDFRILLARQPALTPSYNLAPFSPGADPEAVARGANGGA